LNVIQDVLGRFIIFAESKKRVDEARWEATDELTHIPLKIKEAVLTITFGQKLFFRVTARFV
jgi:hypothetical protein